MSMSTRWRSRLRSLLLVAVSILWIGETRAGAILIREPSGSASPREVYPIWRLRMPHLVRKTRPLVPKRARVHGVYEARVFISAQIDANGHPGFMEVLHCTKPGYGFEQAAIEAAKTWRYEPAQLNGEPVGSAELIIVEFGRESSDA